MNRYIVKKIFNNNVILVDDSGKEKILFEKGIGFNKKEGSTIDKNTKIEKVFYLEDKSNRDKFNQLISTSDNQLIGLCEEIICKISQELNEDLNEKIHISLTDHIIFTLKRLKSDDEIYNPFLVETITLYKKEYQIAEKVVRLLEKKTGINIPDGEIGFIALHIHSARNTGKLSNTIKYTFLCNTIVEFIEDELNIHIKRDSLDYARFITHLRFAIERIINDNPIKNELLSTIKRKYKDSYALAKKAALIIENQLHKKVNKDEIGYIAIYIEKLKK